MVARMAALMLCFFFLVLHMAAMTSFQVHAHSAPPVKAAYWLYQPAASDLSLLNVSDFSHLFFASAILDASTFTVLAPPDGFAAMQSFPSAIRATNPAIKTLLSISANMSTFSSMASSPTSRLAFINSSIALAHTLSFDGLDLDWEFPSSDTDMTNLASLISEWRAACVSSNSSTPLLLTAVVRFNVTVMSTSANITALSGRITNAPVLPSTVSTPISSGNPATYPVQAIAKSLDWINIKAFDYHGAWEPTKTGEHTALFDTSPYQTDYGVGQWLAAGLPRMQAVLGLATYGRTWILQDAMQNNVGVAAVSAGPAGDGIYTYDEIKEFVNSSKAYCRDDVVTKAAFCYGKVSSGSNSKVLWVGFDNPRTIATKVRYLKAKQLRGYFLWNLGFDKNRDLSKQALMAIIQNDHGLFSAKRLQGSLLEEKLN